MNSVDWLRMFKDRVLEEVNEISDSAERAELKAKIMTMYQDQLEKMITPSYSKRSK